MAEEDKVSRRQRKASLTRAIHDVEQFMVEEDTEKVQASEQLIKERFKNFGEAHKKYHAALENDDEIETSDNYYFDVQNSYVNALKSIKQWLRAGGIIKEVKPVPQEAETQEPPPDLRKSPDLNEVISLMQLPKVDIKPFDGNPLKYHAFMTLFDECVDKVSTDNKAKLARLLQFTTGDALDTISSCMLQEDDGYLKARELLK
jgi:hypothetical protein